MQRARYCSPHAAGANGKPSTADANAIIEYNNTSLEVLKSLYSERETNNVLEYMEKHGKTLFAPVIVSKIGVAGIRPK